MIEYEENYTEEVMEAVRHNMDYLADQDIESVIEFIEGLAECIYDGELLEQVVAAMRDRT